MLFATESSPSFTYVAFCKDSFGRYNQHFSISHNTPVWVKNTCADAERYYASILAPLASVYLVLPVEWINERRKIV